jgi:hypothetical protein
MANDKEHMTAITLGCGGAIQSLWAASANRPMPSSFSTVLFQPEHVPVRRVEKP